jgi:branched-chain amino acid transport system permease protein
LEELVQQIINGIVSGGIYALIALGLTLIFGILRIANFAHGQFYMLGAYTAFMFTSQAQIPFLYAMVVVAVIGVVTEWLVFRPLRFTPPVNIILCSLGLSLFLENVVLRIFSPDPRQLFSPYAHIVLSFMGVSVTLQRLLILLIAALLVIALFIFLNRTWSGIAMRAAGQDLTTARLMGINIDRVASITFAIGSALAGASGMLVGSIFLLQPTMGLIYVLKAFVVVILGGVGNVVGAILGSLILGIAESLTVGYVGSVFRDIVAFLVLIVTLLFRPYGLFHRK